MKTWIIRIAIAIFCLTLLSAAGTYLFVRDAVVEMFGGHTELAKRAAPEDRTGRVLLTNVNILSEAGDAFLSGQSILLEDGKIIQIGPDLSATSGEDVLDGDGGYLIPGLIDSHVHLWKSRNDLLLYIANGVTAVREMHGTDLHLKWKDEIEAGAIGPDLFVIAAQLATYNFAEGVWVDMTAERNVVRSDSDVRRTVSSLLEAGFDGFKASSFLSLPAYQAASRDTAELSTPFVGHIPIAAGLKDLWASNQSEIAHVEEFVKVLDREFGGYNSKNTEDFLNYVRERSADVAAKTRENDIVVTGTLALIDTFAAQITDLEPELKAVELEYVNPGIAEGQAMGWLPGTNRYSLPESYKTGDWKERYTRYWTAYAQAQDILYKAFLEAGVTVLAGTDANVPVMVPGFSLHDELLAMQQAGMSPAEALKSATSAPADFMGMTAGRIVEGYDANLVLLRENPLNDISASESIERVFANGRTFDRSQLDDLLQSVRTANAASRKQDIAQFR